MKQIAISLIKGLRGLQTWDELAGKISWSPWSSSSLMAYAGSAVLAV